MINECIIFLTHTFLDYSLYRVIDDDVINECISKLVFRLFYIFEDDYMIVFHEHIIINHIFILLKFIFG